MGRSKHAVLAAVGDISLHGEPGAAVLERGPRYAFAAIEPWLAEADLRFGNLECVFYPDDFPPAELSPRALAASSTTAPALAAAGFDILNLAANHLLDCGTVGLEHTIATLDRLGIAHCGAGMDREATRRPAIVEVNGLRIGFLGYLEDCNYTYGHQGAGAAYLVEEEIARDLAALAERVDVTVLSLHADLEFMETPAVWRRDLSRRLARAGAGLILEHHPHVPQGVERVGDCLIVYSLGNCLFDAHTFAYMRDNGPHTAHSFLLQVELTPAGAGEFQRLPFAITPPPGQRPRPQAGRERERALAYLRDLDAALADDAVVLANWRARCMQMLEVHLRRLQGMSAEEFMRRWSWVLAHVQENRSWTSEVVRMARECFQEQVAADKPFLDYHRPSFGYERETS